MGLWLRKMAYAAIPEFYLKNLRAAAKTGGSRDAIYAKAYKATFGSFDLTAIERDWLAAMKTWK